MKLTLLLLALQLTSTHGFLCAIFGLFASGSAGAIEALLNLQGTGEQDSGFTPFNRFAVDKYERPVFDGCSFSMTAEFQFYNNVSGRGNEPNALGTATMEGTFDLFNFLFSFFQNVCIDGLEVTDLEMEDSPDPAFNQFAEDRINDQFGDPECFEEEE